MTPLGCGKSGKERQREKIKARKQKDGEKSGTGGKSGKERQRQKIKTREMSAVGGDATFVAIRPFSKQMACDTE